MGVLQCLIIISTICFLPRVSTASAALTSTNQNIPISGTSKINVLIFNGASEADATISGCLDHKGQFVSTGSGCDTFTVQPDSSVSSSLGHCGFFTEQGGTVFVCAATITGTTPLVEMVGQPKGYLFFGAGRNYLYTQNPNGNDPNGRSEYALQKNYVSPLLKVTMAWAASQ